MSNADDAVPRDEIEAHTQHSRVGMAKGHPVGFWFFFWGEFAERCSYYGMRAILPLYLTAQLGMSDGTAATWYSAFKMSCYFLPLLGGYLADRYFGKYWTIVAFSIPYVIGQFLIGTVENFSPGFQRDALLLFTFALLAGGSGVIKPNISSLMGLTYDQQRPGNIPLRANAFLWFYFSVNFGSTISMLALPVMRNHFGYQKAFLIPAAFMVLALAAFALGKRFYATETVGPAPPASDEERREQRQVLASLYGIFALLIFFWVVYEHNDNLWVYFARDRMDLKAPGWVPDWFTQEVTIGGTKEMQEVDEDGVMKKKEVIVGGTKEQHVAPDQFQFINALLILILVPISTWFWPKVDPTGKRFPHTFKMLVGLIFTASAPASLALSEFLAGGTKVPMSLMVVAYFLLTVGEVLVYGTGLDLSYAYAPPRLKGFVTACFLVTNALGNLINMVYAPLYKSADGKGLIDPAPYFALDTVILLAAAVAFYFVGRKFNQVHASGSAST